MGGLARHELGGQRGTTRTARQNRGDRGTGDTAARAASSPDTRPSSDGSPAATRTRHGRAGNVPSDGGRRAREPPPHPTERGTPSPAADGRAPLGPAPRCNGRVSAAPTRRAEGHDAHGRAKPGRPGDGRHHRESGKRRPTTGQGPSGSPAADPDAPWPCGQCPERRGAPRARTPATPNRERDTGAPPRTAGHRWGPPSGAMGGLARLQLGGQRGTTRTCRAKTGATGGRATPPRERQRRPTTGQGPSGSPAATRTRHGRAGNVPSDGGRRAREPPPHPTERGTPAPRRGRQGTVGARP
ncbi:hypothetical protein IHE45_20G009600 [Dioscorea alata]|uniref:Uncharacterized protein n=1 Tax=Dioscorea alata TaxID=55571 RepID=A0ACB7TQ52_DIOAL|nr:hypothetical protein IHE45_20G009600 [Dioscorea alata]